MDFTFLLAEGGAETAGEWVGVLQTIVQGGASLILAVVASVLGYAFYKQMRGNSALEKTFREQIKSDADQRADTQRDLLREMLDRDREAQETTQTAMAAVQSMTQVVNELKHELSEVRREVSELRRDIAGR